MHVGGGRGPASGHPLWRGIPLPPSPARVGAQWTAEHQEPAARPSGASVGDPPSPGDNHEQETVDAGRRLRRRLRNHGAVPDAAGGGPYGARGLPRQEVWREHRHRHPRFRRRPDLQREARPQLRAELRFRARRGRLVRRPGDPRRPRPGIPAPERKGAGDRARLRSGQKADRRRLPRRPIAGGRRHPGRPHLLGLPRVRAGSAAGWRHLRRDRHRTRPTPTATW